MSVIDPWDHHHTTSHLGLSLTLCDRRLAISTPMSIMLRLGGTDDWAIKTRVLIPGLIYFS